MASTAIKCIRPDGHPHVRLITIDRPPVNAMSLAAHRELLAALRSVDRKALPDVAARVKGRP